MMPEDLSAWRKRVCAEDDAWRAQQEQGEAAWRAEQEAKDRAWYAQQERQTREWRQACMRADRRFWLRVLAVEVLIAAGVVVVAALWRWLGG